MIQACHIAARQGTGPTQCATTAHWHQSPLPNVIARPPHALRTPSARPRLPRAARCTNERSWQQCRSSAHIACTPMPPSSNPQLPPARPRLPRFAALTLSFTTTHPLWHFAPAFCTVYSTRSCCPVTFPCCVCPALPPLLLPLATHPTHSSLTFPGRVRPALPARCVACTLLMGTTSRESMPEEGT